MYGNDRPDHGKLDYVAMAFGMLIFANGWLWLGGLPATPGQWWFRLVMLAVGVGGLVTCLVMKSRIE